MKANVQRWLKGLGSAAIGGGAGAVASGGITAMIDPEKFNPMTQTLHFLTLTTAVFIASAVMHSFIYLQQHPLPDDTAVFTKSDFPPTNNNQ